MKHLTVSLCLCMMLTFLIPTGSAIPATPPSTPLETIQPWTWLFYDAADAEVMYDPLSDLTRVAYGSQNLTILVLQDTETGPGKLWQINHDHTLTLLQDLGEVNMGDSQTMKDFLAYGKTNFPASRYLLCLYGHGAAWQGSCVEINPSDEILSMHELHQALAAAGGVDLLCYTAPCLMGSVEAAYEVRHDVDVIIADEEISGYRYWTNVVDDISSLLTNQPNLSTMEVARNIIQFLRDENPEYPDISMSAVRTDALDALGSALSTLCKDFLKRWFSSFKPIVQAHQQTLLLGGDLAGTNRLYDLYDFTQNLYSCTTNTKLRQDLQAVQQAFNSTIVSSYCFRPNAHGLSIYFPDSLMNGMTRLYGKTSYGLDFSSDFLWNEFLGLYVLTSLVTM